MLEPKRHLLKTKDKIGRNTSNENNEGWKGYYNIKKDSPQALCPHY